MTFQIIIKHLRKRNGVVYVQPPLSALQQKFLFRFKPVLKFVAGFKTSAFSLEISKFSNPGVTIWKIYRITGRFLS
jgi:hypothetical protein